MVAPGAGGLDENGALDWNPGAGTGALVVAKGGAWMADDPKLGGGVA